jgi:DNA-binding winged helix-turn-helix (wHTH) protein
VSDQCAKCQELQEKLDHLAWLDDLLNGHDYCEIAPPVHLHTKERQTLQAVLRTSMRGRVATYDFLEEYLQLTTQDPRETLRQLVCMIRRKLRPYGVSIKNVSSVGYLIDQASIDILKPTGEIR